MNRYEKAIAACGFEIGMRVGIGNGREGKIVGLSSWVQGVCVMVDGYGPVWAHYYDVIKREHFAY